MVIGYDDYIQSVQSSDRIVVNTGWTATDAHALGTISFYIQVRCFSAEGVFEVN